MGNTFTLGLTGGGDAWLETVPVEQRERFIDDHRLGLYDMTELCARYAVSRKTGCKRLARYDAGGRSALRDRSRAPHTCPHKIAEPVALLLLTRDAGIPTASPRSCCSGWTPDTRTGHDQPSAPPGISWLDTVL